MRKLRCKMCGSTVGDIRFKINTERVSDIGSRPNIEKPYLITNLMKNGIRHKGVVRNYMRKISFLLVHGYHCTNCGYSETDVNKSIRESRFKNKEIHGD